MLNASCARAGAAANSRRSSPQPRLNRRNHRDEFTLRIESYHPDQKGGLKRSGKGMNTQNFNVPAAAVQLFSAQARRTTFPQRGEPHPRHTSEVSEDFGSV